MKKKWRHVDGSPIETRRFAVELDLEALFVLRALGEGVGHKRADETLMYVINSLLDGVRRPGSWERQLLYPLFGEEGVARAQQLLLLDSPKEKKK